MKIKPKKWLGQNFLTDSKVLDDIIRIAKISKNTDVIEIGPGRGALTSKIIKKCKSLVVYEIDNDLIPILQNSLPNKNLKIINEDFLSAKLEWTNKKVLIANIPYYITSKILFKIFSNITLFNKAILMVQKEVGERICAQVGQSSYGKLSVVSHFFSNSQIVLHIPPTKFYPVPKVNSVVLTMEFKKMHLDRQQQNQFLLFLKNCFMMRRKTLLNNLKKINLTLDESNLNALKITKQSRPQELSLEQYIQLFNMFKTLTH